METFRALVSVMAVTSGGDQWFTYFSLPSERHLGLHVLYSCSRHKLGMRSQAGAAIFDSAGPEARRVNHAVRPARRSSMVPGTSLPARPGTRPIPDRGQS